MDHSDSFHPDLEKRVDPRSTRRSDDEVVSPRPVRADSRPTDTDVTLDRRRRERRRIDRMATGI
jgi:hypothetical protein